MNTTHTITSITSIVASHGFPVSEQQQALLSRYVELLLEWNSKINLISRKDEEHVWRNHLLHSLAAMLFVDLPRDGRFVDIGSGGGLPGIPLAIMLPEATFMLVDSVGKKIRAVEEMVEALQLTNVKTVNGRVEDDAVSRHLGRRADVVTARAVTRLEALVRWGRPLLREQGVRKLVAWKGGDLEAELLEARRNPTVQSIREIQIDLPEERMFVTEQKKLVEIRYR